jgi:dipeptidyl aminopeptidase/acylaminoacyl peptidase
MATLSNIWQRFLGAFVLSSVFLQTAAAGTLVKLWELDLSAWNTISSENADRFSVAALSFSPDGKRIALTSAESKRENGELTGLLLVGRIGGAKGDIKSFGVPRGGMVPDWSPSGDAIVVNSVLIQLETGASCALPNIARFISQDQIIGQRRAAQPSRATDFTIFGRNCRPGEAWKTSDEWYTTDVSIERQLLLVNKPHEENLLVDPYNGHVVRRWSVGAWPVWDGPGGQFADNGKALCNELSVSDAPKGKTLRCWKTDTGELIANAPADYATGPFATSQNSTRVVFTEVGYVKGLIRDWDTHPYKGAVVWDYATGEKLASWRPATQTWYELGLRPPKKIVEPSIFAISPDGQFIAEGGNGKLTVFRVEP